MLLREIFPLPNGIMMNYQITLPSDYKEGEKLPLIVFLHGAGERGSSFEKLCCTAVPKVFSKDPDYKGLRVITLCPQCPFEHSWMPFILPVTDLIRAVIQRFNIDEDRVSLTGLSMGGFGTWELSCHAPQLFSAIAPLCGGGLSWRAERIAHLPCRVYHGDADAAVPLTYSLLMTDRLKELGADVEMNILPGYPHNCWDYAYEQTDLLPWLAAQKRTKKETV